MQIRSTVRRDPLKAAFGGEPQQHGLGAQSSQTDLSRGDRDSAVDKKNAKEWADWLKARSTLTGLVEPLGVTIGFAQTPGESLQLFQRTGSAFLHGDFGAGGQGLKDIAYKAYHPEGVGGAVYRSSHGIEALTSGAVGALEVYAGVKSKDKFLTAMGGADLVESLSKASRAASMDGLALGLGIASNVGKTVLVAANLDKFSRTQKVKTFLDAGASISSSMVKSNVLPLPAMAVMSLCGLGQLSYMNVPAVRSKIDKLLDRAFGPEKAAQNDSTTTGSPSE